MSPANGPSFSVSTRTPPKNGGVFILALTLLRRRLRLRLLRRLLLLLLFLSTRERADRLLQRVQRLVRLGLLLGRGDRLLPIRRSLLIGLLLLLTRDRPDHPAKSLLAGGAAGAAR